MQLQQDRAGVEAGKGGPTLRKRAGQAVLGREMLTPNLQRVSEGAGRKGHHLQGEGKRPGPQLCRRDPVACRGWIIGVQEGEKDKETPLEMGWGLGPLPGEPCTHTRKSGPYSLSDGSYGKALSKEVCSSICVLENGPGRGVEDGWRKTSLGQAGALGAWRGSAHFKQAGTVRTGRSAKRAEE